MNSLARRLLVVFGLMLSANVSAQSLFAEANFSDSQYSALIEPLSMQETDLRDSFSGFKLYLATVRVLDVYFGPLKKESEIEIQINVSYIGMAGGLETMSQPFILSFCRSEDEIYYTYRDYLILPANEANVAEFERLRRNGTDFDGDNDCTSTNFDLEPIATGTAVSPD